MSEGTAGRRTLETSNEDKVLYPDDGITKGAVIDHYRFVAGRILPHLRERPLVLQRFPDGIGEEGFYQKQVREHFPDWIETVRVDVGGGEYEQELVVCNDEATLVYLVNLACLALHPWLSRRDRLDRPDQLVIDLDPTGDAFEPARRGALRVRALLRELGLPSYAKLTGSRGVHVLVPLDRSEVFDDVRAFARAAMELLAARHPRELTVEQRRTKRDGRLYLDTGRNAYGQTAVAPWSLRPLPSAPVAVPVPWRLLERRGTGARDYTLGNLRRRLASRADPWDDLRRRARSLAPARRRLEELRERAGSP